MADNNNPNDAQPTPPPRQAFPGRRGRPHGPPFFRVGPVIMTDQLADLTVSEGADEDDTRGGFEPMDDDHFTALQASTHLPPETCVEVLDEAEHWLIYRCYGKHALRLHQHSQVVLASPTLTAHGVESLRRIVVRVRSNDQGWSGEPVETQGTFDNSYTWHELNVGSPDASREQYENHDNQHPGGHLVHKNRQARSQPERLVATFDRDHTIFDELRKAKEKDRGLLVVSRAQYPGWSNCVHFVQLELHFAATFDERELEHLFVEPVGKSAGKSGSGGNDEAKKAKSEASESQPTIPSGNPVTAPLFPPPDSTT